MFIRKRMLPAALAVLLLLSPFAVGSTIAQADEDQNRTVYVTKTGKKHHAKGCSYLRSSSIPIKYKDAVAQGYGACSRCGGG